MKLSEIIQLIELEPLVVIDDPDCQIETVCGCDLMSDVLAFSQEKTMLLTGLTNPHVIRTCEMTDIKFIIFVRGKRPPEETIDLAAERGINLYLSSLSMFECCGRLYQAGLGSEVMRRLE
ncbi:MAG: hypothetical protein QM372_07950 [Bacillota bacterium]|nr:hypothetical protein [Bacillota bacterium]NLJ03503.1 hypothetical protein [Bacillota bacterium]